MKYLIYFIAILIIVGLMIGLFGQLPLGQVVPNLVLLLVIVFAVEKTSLDFVFFALVGGLFLDFYSGLFVGSFTLPLLMTGFVLQFVVNNFLVQELKWYNLLGMVIFAVVFMHLSAWAYSLAAVKLQVASFSLDFHVLRRGIIPMLVYHLALFYPFYIIGNVIKNIVLNLQIKRRTF